MVGLSNGSFMTWRMLREYGHLSPCLIDVYVPVCGLQPVWEDKIGIPKPQNDVKVFMCIGTKDRLVPICGGSIARLARSDKSLTGEGLENWEIEKEKLNKIHHGECCSLSDSVKALCDAMGVHEKTKDRIVPQSEWTVVEGAGEELEVHDTEYTCNFRVWVVKEMGHTFPGTKAPILMSLFCGKTSSINLAVEMLKFMNNNNT